MYQTIQGDTFDKIAKKIYDDEFLMDVLIKANPEHSRTVIFPAGVSLNTPSVPSKKVSAQKLPPWKRSKS